MLRLHRLRYRLIPSLIVALLAAPLSACWSLSYLGEQATGQLHLLQYRRRITDVLRDPATGAETRRRLQLAVEARDFGIRYLGLRGGAPYTRYYDTGGQPVAWNLSAAPRDRVAACSHSFPLVGSVPYLGYFREADARREQARLRARGLDTFLRPVSGYSTLGITADPVYSSMLEGSDAAIVEVVLHEMLHGTVFVPGRFDFNESLATIVGVAGAVEFFKSRGDATQAAAVLAEAERRDRKQAAFASWLEPVLRELEALYASPLSRDEKLRRREIIFTRAQEEYRRRFPVQPDKPIPVILRQPLNNAVLISFAVYHREMPLQRQLLQVAGGDLAALIRLCRHAVEDHEKPINYLRERAGLPKEPPRPRRKPPAC